MGSFSSSGRVVQALATAILPVSLSGCRERLVLESAGGVRFALPAWPHRSAQPSPSAGFVERADGKGDRVWLGWDVDARTGKPDFALAREARGVSRGDITAATVAGHEAWRLSERALVWRCDKTGRLLRLVVEGGHAPSLGDLARQVDCHPGGGSSPGGSTANGDVPSASIAALGPAWRFAHRGRGSSSWLRDDAVLTLFAGQSRPLSTGAEAAPAWAAAAGLTDVTPQRRRPPRGHRVILRCAAPASPGSMARRCAGRS